MALTIEDGTGVTGADSFQTAAECESAEVLYFGTSLTATVQMRDAALRRVWVFMSALDWLDDMWSTFGGSIPNEVKNAQMALARAEITKPGYLSPQVATAGQKVLTGVKGITWDVIGNRATVEGARPVVTMAFDFLRPWLKINPAKDNVADYWRIGE